MKVKTILMIDGIFTLIMGPFFILFTDFALSLIGIQNNPAAVLLFRLYGGLLLMNGIFFIGSKNTDDIHVKYSLIIGSLIVDGLSAVLVVLAAYSGVITWFGYIFSAVFGVIWFLFLISLIRLDVMRAYRTPDNELELSELVKEAHDKGYQVRVRGSAHSVDKAIFTDHFKQWYKSRNEMNIYLNRYAEIVRVDFKRKQIEVQAGMHLGLDPFDPSQDSTWKNSLLYQIDKLGWALPDLGGITHQTVAGFIMTGSMGGSVKYSIGDALIGLRIIDGTGKVHEISRTKNSNLFYAAGVSMGLLGVVSTVTFQCIDKFNIIGQEATTMVDDCAIDLFGKGTASRPSFEKYLRQTEYTRLMWWPQKGVNKMVVWQAKRMQKSDYSKITNPPDGPAKSPFKPKPYEEVGGYPVIAETAAGFFYTIIGNLNRLWIPGKIINKFLGVILPFVLNKFVILDRDKNPPEPQQFWDTSYHGLPMDNQMSDTLMPTEFTEIWIPLTKVKDVMNTLKDHYEKYGLYATGTFTCEIYAAKKSPFWMSPAFGQDVIRIDIFWFARNSGNPVNTYYPQFWELLKPFGFRLHWGKYLAPPESSTGFEYLKKQYPKWNDFMKLRSQMDPKNVFLTRYWRRQLGL